MTNNEKTNAIIKATVTDGEMLALINAAGIRPTAISPLAKIGGQPVMLNNRNLQTSGLTDGGGRPTTSLTEALNILANPTSEIDLVWGNPNGISLSRVYSAGGQDRLVSFTSINGENNISCFLTSQDIIDLLNQKLAFTDIKDIAPINAEGAPAVIPAFFALLDAYRENQLRAALERRQETAVTVSQEDLNRIVQEAKMETNYSWYTPIALAAMPLDIDINESTVAEGLRILKSEGVTGENGELSDSLAALAYRAFPIGGFCGIKILTSSGNSIEKTQLALFRGLSTLLLVQIETGNGNPNVIISSISTAELPELLYNLGMRPFEVTVPPTQPATQGAVMCSKCGTPATGGEKFCKKCGTPLSSPAAGPKFCSKCGTPATGGEKFCKKCGTPLK